MLEKTDFSIDEIEKVSLNIEELVIETPFQKNDYYSQYYGANVFLKREDLQRVRSYKIRGAFNKIRQLEAPKKKKGVVCASAGNHAQGVALCCAHLQINGVVFMPSPTPKQKIEQVKMFGENFVEVKLTGDTYDDAYKEGMAYSKKFQKEFIHPFNDPDVIAGQATVGLEIWKRHQALDYILLPVGGGGLASGVSSFIRNLSPNTKIIGVEPEGAPSMTQSIEKNQRVILSKMDRFVDGAAVKQVGELTFEICKKNLHSIITVPEGKICTKILELYNKEAIVVEPAGALSITALDTIKEEIKGKNVCCIVSGSNNDISRMAEIKERALLYENLKHYFVIKFPQRAGALKEFVNDILGPNDDITFFEYSKKHSRESGPAVVGIELKNSKDFTPLLTRIKSNGFYSEYLNNKAELFQYLI